MNNEMYLNKKLYVGYVLAAINDIVSNVTQKTAEGKVFNVLFVIRGSQIKYKIKGIWEYVICC